MDKYEVAPPFARATITPDRLTLNAWNPKLIGLGPRNRLLEGIAPGTTLVDLSTHDGESGNEVVVHPICGDLESAAAKLITWAEDTGYSRVWFPDRIVAVEPTAVHIGVARVRCPTCGIDWAEPSPEFLVGVRQTGYFPPACISCGGSLPEWSIDLDPQELSGELTFTS